MGEKKIGLLRKRAKSNQRIKAGTDGRAVAHKGIPIAEAGF